MDFDNVDEKTAFKLGFATYCADNGLSTKEAAELLKSSAIGPWVIPALTAGLTAVGAGVANFGKGLAQYAPEITATSLAVPTAAGLAIGGGLGHLAAKSEEPELSPEDIQAQEIADTYKRYTDRIKARKAYQQYRTARDMA